MLAINQEAMNRKVENVRVYRLGQTPQLTSDQAGLLPRSSQTHSHREGAWTSGSAYTLERHFEATKVGVARLSVAAALTSQRVGKGWFIVPYIPSDDTSNTIGYAPRISAAPALASQRVGKACLNITYISGDDTSYAIDYVPELKRHFRLQGALRRSVSEIAERFVARIRSDSEISLGELQEKFQESAPADEDLAARQRELLARAGGGLTTTEVAQRLNLSEQEVDELRTAGRLFAVPDPDGPGWTYPRCQFEGPRVVPGLPEVLSNFAVKSPWTRLYVLIGEDPALDGRTPFEALKDGDLDRVREIIGGYGQQGGD